MELAGETETEEDAPEKERVITLNCRHRYHEFCIRGWMIVGKKDTCPYCNEKVDLKQTFTTPWEKTSIVWANLLDMVRPRPCWCCMCMVHSWLARIRGVLGPCDSLPNLPACSPACVAGCIAWLASARVGALPGGVEPNHHHDDATVAARNGFHAGPASGTPCCG